MYNIILADPPWSYSNWGGKGGGKHERKRGANKHYETMTLDKICALDVASIADDRCALFIWATWPLIFNVKTVIDAWGFEYKTLAWEWVKMVKDGSRPKMGMGYYTRGTVEPCLLAFRGKPFRPENRGMPNVLFSSVGRHSKKPFKQYERIDSLYPKHMKRVELFAREPVSGWDAWGNEIESDLNLGG